MLLEGLHIPLTTPFHPDGRLHLHKLEQNVARYSLTPAAGMMVLGEAGEPAFLSDAETRDVLAAAIAAAAPHKVMLAGCSRPSVAETLHLIAYAEVLGYDAALVHAPILAGLTQNEHCLFFQAVADRAALPLVLAGDLAIDLVAGLAFHPRILGQLSSAEPDAMRDLLTRVTARRTVTVTPVFAAVTRRMMAAHAPHPQAALLSSASLVAGGTLIAAAPRVPLKTRTKVVGFQLLAASAGHLLDGLRAGAIGACPSLTAAIPQACYEVYAAWNDGDEALAEEKQLRLQDAAKQIRTPAALKFACDRNGYFGGVARLPQLPVSAEEETKIDAALARS